MGSYATREQQSYFPCVTGTPGDYKRCRCASLSLIFSNSGLEKWNFLIYMLFMTTVYHCCSWGWDLCQAIQSWVSLAVTAHTSCAASEPCGAVSSSAGSLWQPPWHPQQLSQGCPARRPKNLGARFSPLSSSWHQKLSKSKGSIKTESTWKQ